MLKIILTLGGNTLAIWTQLMHWAMLFIILHMIWFCTHSFRQLVKLFSNNLYDKCAVKVGILNGSFPDPYCTVLSGTTGNHTEKTHLVNFRTMKEWCYLLKNHYFKGHFTCKSRGNTMVTKFVIPPLVQ